MRKNSCNIVYVTLVFSFGIIRCSSSLECPEVPSSPGGHARHNGRCCVTILCKPGKKPQMCEDGRPESIDCIDCPDGEFMENVSESYLMKKCSAHEPCESRKRTLGGGNTTHNFICECNVEGGYVDDPNKLGDCIYVCPAGQQMDDSGMCEPCQEGYFKRSGEEKCIQCLDCGKAGRNTSSTCNKSHDSICSHAENLTENKMADNPRNELYYLLFLFIIPMLLAASLLYFFFIHKPRHMNRDLATSGGHVVSQTIDVSSIPVIKEQLPLVSSETTRNETEYEPDHRSSLLSKIAGHNSEELETVDESGRSESNNFKINSVEEETFTSLQVDMNEFSEKQVTRKRKFSEEEKIINDAIKERFRACFYKIAPSIEPRGWILNRLVSDGVITINTHKEIQDLPTQGERITQLHITLRNTHHPQSFIVFREAIREGLGLSWIDNLLKDPPSSSE